MLKISKAICWLRRGIKWVESLIDDDLKEKEIFYDGSQKKVSESVTEVKKKTENNCAINHELQFFPSFCLLFSISFVLFVTSMARNLFATYINNFSFLLPPLICTSGTGDL